MSAIIKMIDRRSANVPHPNNVPYVLAVVFMMTLGVVSIVLLTIMRPEKDNTLIVTTLIGFLAPTTLSLLAFMKSQETHLSVNGRMESFIASEKLRSRLEGIEEGRTQIINDSVKL